MYIAVAQICCLFSFLSVKKCSCFQSKVNFPADGYQFAGFFFKLGFFCKNIYLLLLRQGCEETICLFCTWIAQQKPQPPECKKLILLSQGKSCFVHIMAWFSWVAGKCECCIAFRSSPIIHKQLSEKTPENTIKNQISLLPFPKMLLVPTPCLVPKTCGLGTFVTLTPLPLLTAHTGRNCMYSAQKCTGN